MKHIYATTAIGELSLGAPLLLQGDLLQAVKKTAALGYEAMEIHVTEPSVFPTALLADACDAHGIRIAAIATGRVYTMRNLCITSTEPKNREAAMQELYAYVDIAAELNAMDGVVIGWVKGKRPSNADGFDDLLAVQLQKLAGYAAQKGQKLLIEVINRYETNVFNTCEELLAFLTRYDIPNAYIHLDTFHMNIDESNPAEAIRSCGKRLGYFHVADNTRLYPGSGMLDFKSYFSVLKEIGYKGFVSVECLPCPDGETAARKALEYLKQCEPEIKIES
jgi:sugar phosphate isomerase/epimerase